MSNFGIMLGHLARPSIWLSKSMRHSLVKLGMASTTRNLSLSQTASSKVLVIILFAMSYLILKTATEETDGNMYIHIHKISNPFNLKQLLTHTKIIVQLVRELLLSDDMALIAHSEVAIQQATCCFERPQKPSVSKKKYHSLSVYIDRKKLILTYLGCIIFSFIRLERNKQWQIKLLIGNTNLLRNKKFNKEKNKNL